MNEPSYYLYISDIFVIETQYGRNIKYTCVESRALKKYELNEFLGSFLRQFYYSNHQCSSLTSNYLWSYNIITDNKKWTENGLNGMALM